MRKVLCILALGALLTTPIQVGAQMLHDSPENELPTATSIVIKGNTVHVSGADGEILHVYSLTGIEVTRYKIDGNDVQVNMGGLQKGYYIIKVGKIVRKISIR